MSKVRLLRALGKLKHWELKQPDVLHAVQVSVAWWSINCAGSICIIHGCDCGTIVHRHFLNDDIIRTVRTSKSPPTLHCSNCEQCCFVNFGIKGYNFFASRGDSHRRTPVSPEELKHFRMSAVGLAG